MSIWGSRRKIALEMPKRRRRQMEFRFTTENFEEEVLQSSVPVLVDFFADWCGPCKMMAPIVEKLAEEYDGRVKVGKCNTDENLQVAQRYRISSIPTFIIFKDGKPAATFMGAMSAKDLKDKVENALK
jgi:thioredoxin 1